MPTRLLYELHISAYSPTTIPLARLAGYMADLAGVLGEHRSVHFAHLKSGSTGVAVAIEHEAIPKIEKRLKACQEGESPSDLVKAYASLDERLAEDNARGELRNYTPQGEKRGAVILTFAGRDRPKPVDYGPVWEQGSIDGVLISLGGRSSDGASLPVILQGADQLYTGVYVSRPMLIELSDAAVLLRKDVRLYGKGKWRRGTSGGWTLERFNALGFDVLGDASLGELAQDLRSIPGSGWDELEDPLGVLQELRSEPDDRPH